MNKDDRKRLRQFFNRFNVGELGRGDTIAGANTLVAMCSALAGASHPDSGILTENGRIARIGTNVLVSGPLSSGIVQDDVITRLGDLQTNFSRHLRRNIEWKEEMKQDLSINVPEAIKQSRSEELLCGLQINPGMELDSPGETWARILREAPGESNLDMAARPKFFVSASTPRDLGKRLTGLRSGRVLLHLGLHRESDLEGFGDGVAALLDGCHPVGNHGETAGGNLLVTDPLQLLGVAARDASDRTAWLGQAVWLADGKHGENFRTNMDVAGYSLVDRFYEALSRGLGQRIHGGRDALETVRADFLILQNTWTRFLREMERSVPGIPGTARNLPATLTFGLSELSYSRYRKDLECDLGDVDVFARFIVHRMSAARTSIMFAADEARRQNLIRKIFEKLDTLGLDERNIYKNLKIPADDCRRCLRWLEESGLARRCERGWRRVDGAKLTFAAHALPVLDI